MRSFQACRESELCPGGTGFAVKATEVICSTPGTSPQDSLAAGELKHNRPVLSQVACNLSAIYSIPTLDALVCTASSNDFFVTLQRAYAIRVIRAHIPVRKVWQVFIRFQSLRVRLKLEGRAEVERASL